MVISLPQSILLHFFVASTLKNLMASPPFFVLLSFFMASLDKGYATRILRQPLASTRVFGGTLFGDYKIVPKHLFLEAWCHQTNTLILFSTIQRERFFFFSMNNVYVYQSPIFICKIFYTAEFILTKEQDLSFGRA